MRIAIYARVSTKETATNKQEYTNQLNPLREFIDRKGNEGWKLVEEFIDRASGGSSDRVEFKRMMECASRKEFDLVLFWSLDRFSREGIAETFQHLKRLTNYGVDWFSYKEEFLRSIGPIRDVILAVLAFVAEFERNRQSERVKAGIARAQKEGKPYGRKKTIVDRVKVMEMHNSGVSASEIGKIYSTSKFTIYRILKEIKVDRI